MKPMSMIEEGEASAARLREAGWTEVTLEVIGKELTIKATDCRGQARVQVRASLVTGAWGTVISTVSRLRPNAETKIEVMDGHSKTVPEEDMDKELGKAVKEATEILLRPPPRAEVLGFSRMMELKLQRGDFKHGDAWKSMKVRELFQLLKGHVDKLAFRIRGNGLPLQVEADGADVANLSMMVALRRADHPRACPAGPIEECDWCRLPPPEDEAEKLRAAIRKHRDQRGDDRCWVDDMELYGSLPEAVGTEILALPPRDVFLSNCARFHEFRQAPGTDAASGEAKGRWITAEDAALFDELKEKASEGR